MPYFDNVAPEWAQCYERSDVNGYLLRERRDRILELLQGKGGRLLDVGCGSGALAPYLANMGFDYWAIDASSRMVEEGRAAFARAEASLVGLGEVGHLPFADDSFDVAVCIAVIVWVSDVEQALAELSRVVRPGGTVLLSFAPNLWSPYGLWRTYAFMPAVAMVKRMASVLTRRPVAPHLTGRISPWTPRSVARLLALHGVNMRRVVYYNYNVMLSPLDELFPRAAMRVARRLAVGHTTRWRRFGAGFIVEAMRQA